MKAVSTAQFQPCPPWGRDGPEVMALTLGSPGTHFPPGKCTSPPHTSFLRCLVVIDHKDPYNRQNCRHNKGEKKTLGSKLPKYYQASDKVWFRLNLVLIAVWFSLHPLTDPPVHRLAPFASSLKTLYKNRKSPHIPSSSGLVLQH